MILRQFCLVCVCFIVYVTTASYGNPLEEIFETNPRRKTSLDHLLRRVLSWEKPLSQGPFKRSAEFKQGKRAKRSSYRIGVLKSPGGGHALTDGWTIRKDSLWKDFKSGAVEGAYRPVKGEIGDLLVMDPSVQMDREGHVGRRDLGRMNDVVQGVEDVLEKDMDTNPDEPIEVQLESEGMPLNPQYMKTICKRLPGRIVCKSGRYTFVINNGDYELEPKTVANFIGLLYKRVKKGDRSFVISVQEVPTTLIYRDFAQLRERTYRRAESIEDELPVTVECNRVSSEHLTMVNPREQPLETLFECRWLLLGLKKRESKFEGREWKANFRYPCQTVPLDVRNFPRTCEPTEYKLHPTTPIYLVKETPPTRCPPLTTIRCPLTTVWPTCPTIKSTPTTTCPGAIDHPQL